MASKQHQDVLEHLRRVNAQLSTRPSGEQRYETVRVAMNLMYTAPAIESCRVFDSGLVAPAAQWILDPNCDAERRLLYLHGGGYIAGGLDSHRNIAMWVSRLTRCAVLLLDYRLAPEHPFPAALADAVAAFRWMRGNGPAGAGTARRTFLAGDSAGGGLALASLLELRDRHNIQADAAVTFSAWTNLSNSSPSVIANQNPELGAVKEVMEYFSEQYLGSADSANPLASPFCGTLRGLPPLLMQVSSAEMVYDDSVEFAEKARAAGVSVELQTWPDMVHVFQGYVPQLPEAEQALKRAGEFIRAIV